MPPKRRAGFPRLVRESSKTRVAAAPRAKAATPVYVLKVTLLGTRPPIWRRLAVPADITLARLHAMLQVVMGWYDCHLHRFVSPDQTRYGPLSEVGDADWDLGLIDERKAKLSRVLAAPKQRMVYEYDFGDGWEHGIQLEKIVAPEPGLHYPRCLAGRRACPPEDCGGVWGYAELLQIIADPGHPEHAERLEWLGGPIDPEAFDPDEVNKLLKRVR